MQDISRIRCERIVSRTSGAQALAEIKAADQVLASLGRRLCILGRYVGAVLTACLSPAAPILSIQNAHRAGHGAFTSAQVDGFLSPATSRLRRDRPMPIHCQKAESEGKRKRVVSTFLVRFV